MDIDNLRFRYRGETASDYEEKRKNTGKWRREQETVRSFLEQIVEQEDEPLVLDVPVGTGRFFDLYEEKSLTAIGVDVSKDMLEEARVNLADRETNISLREGDIFNLSATDIDPDIVVCIRFMNWVELDDLELALSSIARTNPEHIVVGVRVRTSTKHHICGMIRKIYHLISRTGENKTKIHDEQSVHEIYSKYKFDIVDKKLVDKWTFGDKYIYRLASEEI